MSQENYDEHIHEFPDEFSSSVEAHLERNVKATLDKAFENIGKTYADIDGITIDIKDIDVKSLLDSLINDAEAACAKCIDLSEYDEKTEIDPDEFKNIYDQIKGIEEILENITVEDFTRYLYTSSEYAVIGDGFFDKIIETCTHHLQAQFDGNRIRQEDYGAVFADLYKTNLTVAMDAWFKFKTLPLEVAKIKAEILIKEKTLLLDMYKTRFQAYQIKAEASKANAQVLMSRMQAAGELLKVLVAKAQVELNKGQAKAEELKISLYDAQAAGAYANAIESDHKVEYIDAQTDQINYKTEELDPIAKEKALQEVRVEKQREELFKRQAEAFDDEFKQKMMKIMLDSWSVGFSVSEDAFSAEDVGGIPVPMTTNGINTIWQNFVMPEFNDAKRYAAKMNPDGTHATDSEGNELTVARVVRPKMDVTKSGNTTESTITGKTQFADPVPSDPSGPDTK